MKKKLILFGDSAFAEIAYEYFTHDSSYEVVAFTVHEQFITRDSLFGLPIVPFENIEEKYSPASHDMHIALVYNKLNRIRAKIYRESKEKGYRLANYISSKAFVWRNVTLGDNVFIFEDNTVQPFVKIGSNVVLWSGNHIGHHSSVGSHCFISSHVVISGFCNVGESCFMGVNSTVGNNIDIGADCFIGAAAMVSKNIPNGVFLKGIPSKIEEISVYKRFGIEDEVD